MQGPGHQFLAGAVLAGDQHRGVGGGDQGQFFAQAADGVALADDLLDPGALLPESPVLFGKPGQLQPIAHRQQDLVGVGGLFNEVIGPQAGGLDGVFHRTVGGDHDHRQQRLPPLEFAEHLQTIEARQVDVQQHQVRRLRGRQFEGGFAIRGGGNFKALILQDARHHPEDLGLVVNYQQVSRHIRPCAWEDR